MFTIFELRVYKRLVKLVSGIYQNGTLSLMCWRVLYKLNSSGVSGIILDVLATKFVCATSWLEPVHSTHYHVQMMPFDLRDVLWCNWWAYLRWILSIYFFQMRIPANTLTSSPRPIYKQAICFFKTTSLNAASNVSVMFGPLLQLTHSISFSDTNIVLFWFPYHFFNTQISNTPAMVQIMALPRTGD